jgi:hypothetical protein
MPRSPTQQLEIPCEMRVVAERSVEQAKLAFDNYIQVIEDTASTFEERVEASQVGPQDISKMAMNFALRDTISAFEFAQKIIQARNIGEFIRFLAEFINLQLQVLSEQLKDLGETFSKATMDSIKILKMGDASS